MDGKLLLLVALASGLGGAARYLLSGWTTLATFPTGTLLVNVLGCFLIGLVIFGGLAGAWLGPTARVVVGIGVLGGFTTMSTFTFETVALAESGAAQHAILYVLATLLLCLGATLAGRGIGLALWASSA